MTKSERLIYIKEVAARIREEKAYIARMCQEDAVAPVEADTDFLSIENIQGFVMEGIQKVAGGIRKMPVIIL
jgi:hypothetical protein